MDHAFLSFTPPRMSPILQRNLHWVGSGLAILGIVFVTLRLHGYWGDLDFSLFTVNTLVSIMELAILYGTTNLLLALAWWRLLSHLGVQVTPRWSIRTYGISQLAKYLPGNIFHLAGRQVLGMAAGISGVALAKSTLWELGLLAVTGALYGCLIFSLLFPQFDWLAGAALFAGLGIGIFYILYGLVSKQVASAFLLYIVFLGGAGTIFVVIASLFASSSDARLLTWLPLGGAYIIAWLVGLVTPGAPAGVGVRELFLLFFAKGVLPEAGLLLVILIGRVVTTLGDLLFFVICLTLKKLQTTANPIV